MTQIMHSRAPVRRTLSQRGQSMTEFVVLSIVLVPLLLSVPLLGKYMDLAQQSTTASRYAAFEISVRGPANAEDVVTVAAETRRRFFSNSDAPIKTDDIAGNFAAHRNPLWSDNNADTFLPNFDDNIRHDRAQEGSNSPTGAWLSGGAGFKLPNDNLYTANIDVLPKDPTGVQSVDPRLKWNGDVYRDGENVKLPMNRKTGIMIDSWAATSVAQARSRVENAGLAAYPIDILKAEGLVFRGLTWPMLDPNPDFGKVDPEIIPCDRLNPPTC